MSLRQQQISVFFGTVLVIFSIFAAGENTENNHDRAEKDCDLLLAQAHCRDRITDRPKPAKLKGPLRTPASCAQEPGIA